MAYKKYIKKDGRTYGPYIYSSKRVDGKVVSEYLGQKEKGPITKNVFIFITTIIVIVALSLVLFLNSKNSGFAVLNLNGNYLDDGSLDGNLVLTLNKGEFIPYDSKILFEDSINSYEYSFADLVSQEPSEGEFYISGKEVSGQGLGYGVPGTKITYPNVYFGLEIIKNSENSLESKEEPVQEITSIETSSEEIQTQEESFEIVEKTVQEKIEEDVPEVQENSKEVITEENSNNPSLTGNAIRGVGGFFSKFKSTGNTISEQNIIQGDIVYGEEFVYNLNADETAKLISGTVMTETIQLPDNTISLNIEDGKAIVKTNYYEQEQGYGEEFIENQGAEILINIPQVEFAKGNFKIKIIYNNQEIIILETVLDSGEINETIEEIQNETIQLENITELNETNISIKTFEPYNVSLTEKEIQILKENFGNLTVKQKASSYKDKIIVTFTLGNYEANYSYDSLLNKRDFEYLINKDRVNWLKDLAKKLSSSQTNYETVENFSSTYEF